FYNRFRYYLPEAACYLSPDPTGLWGGENTYSYVQNPTGWIDPFGLAGKDCQDVGKDIKNKEPEPLLLLPHNPKKRIFKGDEAVKHFEKHGSEMMQALNRKSYNLKDYINDANHVIEHGKYVPEMNGYAKFIGGQGSAKYAFVGLDRKTGHITTLHVKSVSELSRKAPSLGLSK
ncbi:RHS repeat domain-containing protein, partial [Photorhabdus caribbeanensis]|uniref:RHS repeat domain-containing protein n=1 Tax=Photorhabdus caribbeanensis TaxID=1004165 RepID=UPI001BD27CAB